MQSDFWYSYSSTDNFFKDFYTLTQVLAKYLSTSLQKIFLETTIHNMANFRPVEPAFHVLAGSM